MTNSNAAGRTLRRLKEMWDELDYAQRRLLEIRTGLPLSAEAKRPQARQRPSDFPSYWDLEFRTR